MTTRGTVPPRRGTTDDPAFAADATVEVADVSVWFGQKVALSELSCSFGPGVTGLLGPNGAGKTTLMRAIVGLVGVNQGAVRVEGRDRGTTGRSTRGSRSCRRTKPSRPRSRPASSFATWPTSMASPIAARRMRALALVGMLDAADRSVDGFSKGMRQRTKVASALVCDPRRARARRAAERRRPGAARQPDRAVQAARRARGAP